MPSKQLKFLNAEPLREVQAKSYRSTVQAVPTICLENAAASNLRSEIGHVSPETL